MAYVIKKFHKGTIEVVYDDQIKNSIVVPVVDGEYITGTALSEYIESMRPRQVPPPSNGAAIEALVQPDTQQPLPPTVNHSEVSAAQARVVLKRHNLLNNVKQLVNQSDEEVQLWFEYATVWQRHNPHVLALGTALALSPQYMDDLFVEASQVVT